VAAAGDVGSLMSTNGFEAIVHCVCRFALTWVTCHHQMLAISPFAIVPPVAHLLGLKDNRWSDPAKFNQIEPERFYLRENPVHG
jgi:hypothetical protein